MGAKMKKLLNQAQQSHILSQFDHIDELITAWMARYGLLIMRVGLGVVFLWFGMLKLVPGLSPAEDLVRNTVYFINPDIFLPILAIWEALIGLGLTKQLPSSREKPRDDRIGRVGSPQWIMRNALEKARKEKRIKMGGW